MKIFVSGDAAALAVGADAVAAAVGGEVVRNGSRGMFELEPLLEIETPAGRIGFARVEPDDVPAASRAIESLFDAWENGTSIARSDPAAVAEYERRNLTAKLARALDSM